MQKKKDGSTKSSEKKMPINKGEVFRDNLRKIEHMTLEDLQEAVDLIPNPLIKQKLSEGPCLFDRYVCNICKAFGKGWYMNVEFDPEDMMVRAFFYHEIPKIYIYVANQQWYGSLAGDIHRRCLETYRAAGWNDTKPS